MMKEYLKKAEKFIIRHNINDEDLQQEIRLAAIEAAMYSLNITQLYGKFRKLCKNSSSIPQEIIEDYGYNNLEAVEAAIMLTQLIRDAYLSERDKELINLWLKSWSMRDVTIGEESDDFDEYKDILIGKEWLNYIGLYGKAFNLVYKIGLRVILNVSLDDEITDEQELLVDNYVAAFLGKDAAIKSLTELYQYQLVANPPEIADDVMSRYKPRLANLNDY